MTSTAHDDPSRPPSTVIVVGASRGLGRAIALTLAGNGATVIGVSRTAPPLAAAGTLHTVIADGADPAVPADLLGRYDPDAVVLVAGATPQMRPLQQHTWESFSAHWDAEVQISFRWMGEILRRPMRPGGRVISISSGAALAGSPLSGGYAGAKATQRFVAAYAQEEARRAGLDLTVTTLFPQFAPLTAVGAAGVAAYAEQAGRSIADYLDGLPFPPLSPEIAGEAVDGLLRTAPAAIAPGYLLNGAGLHPLDA